MDKLKSLPWSLILGLGGIALVRPLMNITGIMDLLGKPLAPVLVTVGISVVWIAIVGLSRVAQPVLTLVFAGLAYGVFTIVLSGVLSPILTGELQGPLASPFSIIPILVVNATWGAVTGAVALLIRGMCRNSRAGDLQRHRGPC